MSRAPALLALLAWLAGLLLLLYAGAGGPNRHTLAGLILVYLALWGAIFLWSGVSRSEKAARFLLATAALALAISSLELAALADLVDFRAVFPTPMEDPWEHPSNLLDPKLRHLHRPHLRGTWWNVEYRFDRYGLRNEVDRDSADIVVVGDSFIEGLGVRAEQLVTAYLAHECKCTVVNVGQSWYGPQQELELLRRFGSPLRPRVCVWAFFEGNDLADIPRYETDTRNWPAISEDLRSFSRRSFTKNALLAIRRLVMPKREPGPPADIRGTFSTSSGQAVSLVFGYKGRRLSEEDERALEVLTSVLAEAQVICGSGGGRLLVAFIPTTFRVYRDFTVFSAESDPPYWVLNDLPARLDALVRDKLPGAGFLDLTPALREEASRGGLVYLPEDGHWSPEGHRVAAVAIARILARWDEQGPKISP